MFGMLIHEDDSLLDFKEDWSGVRSPSRAARRRKQGHPQRIKITATPKTEAYSVTIDGRQILVMHPAMAQQLRAMSRQAEASRPSIFGGVA